MKDHAYDNFQAYMPVKEQLSSLEIQQSRSRRLRRLALFVAIFILAGFLYADCHPSWKIRFGINHDPIFVHDDKTSPFGPAGPELKWLSCGDKFQCANLSVPLDYLNEKDTRTASIAITRYLATNRTSKTGTIIFNPGGPGGSGTGSTYRLGPILDEVLKGQYDILGFDPVRQLAFLICPHFSL